MFENTDKGYVIVPNDFEQPDFCGLTTAKWNEDKTEAIIEGKCGDNCDYTVDIISGEMIISGSGTMTDFMENTQPWNSYRNSIKEVLIEEGITSVGSYAFYDMKNLEKMEYKGNTIVDKITKDGVNYDIYEYLKKYHQEHR